MGRWGVATRWVRAHLMTLFVSICVLALLGGVIGARARHSPKALPSPSQTPAAGGSIPALAPSPSLSPTPLVSNSPTKTTSPKPSPSFHPVANGDAGMPAISGSGRYVAFSSDASNLVAGDTNKKSDVFLEDMTTGIIRRISLTDSGGQANGDSGPLSISSDGSLVIMASNATNLISGLETKGSHLYAYSTVTKHNEMIDVTPTGSPGHGSFAACCYTTTAQVSGDGRYVVFNSPDNDLVPNDTNNAPDVFLRDRTTGKTERVSVSSTGEEASSGAYPGTDSALASVSDDGRWVVFESTADNLAAGGDPNGYSLFIRDRSSGTTEVVDRQEQYGIVSPDGRYVTTVSDGVYIWDTNTKQTTRVDPTPGSAEIGVLDVSRNASVIAWAEDSPGFESLRDNILTLDRASGRRIELDVASFVNSGNLVVARDGSTIAFATDRSSKLGLSRDMSRTFIEVCQLATASCRVVSDPS